MSELIPHRNRGPVARMAALAGLVASVVTLIGCASTTPTDPMGPPLTAPMNQGAAWGMPLQGNQPAPNSFANGAIPSNPMPSTEAWSSNAFQMGVSPPPSDGFFSSMRNAASSVKDAFAIQTQVAPAYDPVSLATDPGEATSDLHLQAGRVYETQGNNAAALDHYQRALASDPQNRGLLVSMARLHDRQGDYQQALAAYDKALHVAPQDPSIWNNMGMCHVRNGASNAAIPALERAVHLQPMNKLYRNNLAIALVELGRHDVALEHLRLVHGDAVAHYNLGFLLNRRGMTTLAQQHFAQALQIAPNLAQARTMIEKIQAASLDNSNASETPTTTPHMSEHPYPTPPPSSPSIRTLPPL